MWKHLLLLALMTVLAGPAAALPGHKSTFEDGTDGGWRIWPDTGADLYPQVGSLCAHQLYPDDFWFVAPASMVGDYRCLQGVELSVTTQGGPASRPVQVQIAGTSSVAVYTFATPDVTLTDQPFLATFRDDPANEDSDYDICASPTDLDCWTFSGAGDFGQLLAAVTDLRIFTNVNAGPPTNLGSSCLGPVYLRVNDRYRLVTYDAAADPDLREYPDIQSALGALGTSGFPYLPTVWVMPGVQHDSVIDALPQTHAISAPPCADAPTIMRQAVPGVPILTIIGEGSAVVHGLTFEHATAPSGPAITVAQTGTGDFLMEDCTFRHCDATTGDGGAVSVNEGRVVSVARCTFAGNASWNGRGGGLAVANVAYAQLASVTATDNSAVTGGALAFSGAFSAVLTGCEVSGNVAELDGGGIAGQGAGVELRPLEQIGGGLVGEVSSNHAGRDGGGIAIRDGGLAIFVPMASNTAPNGRGGAVFLHGDASSVGGIGSSSFTGNSSHKGGALALLGVRDGFSLWMSSFAANTAADSGGAAWLHDAGGGFIGSTFANNSAGDGSSAESDPLHPTGAGGAIALENASLYLGESTLIGNHARYGGAVALMEHDAGNTVAQITDTTMGSLESGNEAVLYGGGLYVLDAEVVLEACRIVGNTAMMGGGVAGRGVLLEGVPNPDEIFTSDEPARVSRGSLSMSGFDWGAMEITNNAATMAGGGIAILGKDPGAALEGGSLARLGGMQLRATDVTISGNTVNGVVAGDRASGGGVFIAGEGAVGSILEHCLIEANGGADRGAGLAILGVGSTILRGNALGPSVLGANAADVDGGAIDLRADARLRVQDAVISGNLAGDDGGGMYLGHGSVVQIEASLVDANTAQGGDGGGIFVGNAKLSSVGANSMTNNVAGTVAGASGDGGGLAIRAAPGDEPDAGAWLANCSFDCDPVTHLSLGDFIGANTAAGHGGAIAVDGQGSAVSFTATGTSLVGNAASGRVVSTWAVSPGYQTSGLHFARTPSGLSVLGGSIEAHAGAGVTVVEQGTGLPGSPAACSITGTEFIGNLVGLHHVDSDGVLLQGTTLSGSAAAAIVVSDAAVSPSVVDCSHLLENAVGVGVVRGRAAVAESVLADNATAIEARLRTEAADMPTGGVALDVTESVLSTTRTTGDMGVRVAYTLASGIGAPFGSGIHVNANDIRGFTLRPVGQRGVAVTPSQCPGGPQPFQVDATGNWWGCGAGPVLHCASGPSACSLVTRLLDTGSPVPAAHRPDGVIPCVP